MIADSAGIASGTASTAAYVLKIILGVLLLLGAFRQWRGRPREDGKPKMPKWMESIDRFTWPKSLGLGALLSGVNPKNLALTAAAAALITESGLSSAQQAGHFWFSWLSRR